MSRPRLWSVLAMAGLLLGTGALGIVPLLPAGAGQALIPGMLLGLLLSGLLARRPGLLPAAALAAAVLLGLIAALWPVGSTVTVSVAGLAVAETGLEPLSPGAIFALAGLAVLLAACCGWLLADRRQPWPVLALAGSAWLVRADVNRAYEARFPLFALGALLLLALIFSPTGRRLTAPLVLTAGALLVALTWTLPVPRLPVREGVNDPVSVLARSRELADGSQILTLAGPFRGGNEPVMLINIDRRGVRPYWQTGILDRYNGGSWSSVSASTQAFPAAQYLAAAPPSNNTITATVEVVRPAVDLVTAGSFVRASIPVVAAYGPDGMQPNEVQAAVSLAPGSVYEVDGDLTPAAVLGRIPMPLDLQLPPEPARVAALAKRLVTGRRTVLDRALALDRYLRDSGQFTYDANAGSPPGRDAVYDFLFAAHRGYCAQFASSLVVLAREDGIPARLVVGYSTGQEVNGTFVVRARDAHSWAQVYVPNTGWVNLDPTPGFGAYPTSLPAETAVLAAGSRQVGPVTTISPPRGNGAGWGRAAAHHPPVIAAARPHSHLTSYGALGSLGLLAVLLTLAYLLRPRSLPVLYRSMLRSTPRRLGGPRPDETPHEYARRFSGTRAYADVRLVADLYARQRYARYRPDAAELQSARRAWWRLQRRRLRGIGA